MSTTSTIEPGLGDNWSSFGAIVFVSVLGPALILALTIAPVVVVELASVTLDFSLCKYVDTCAPGGIGEWSSRLANEYFLLYVCWVTLATGFACVATLESAFHIFPRAAPIPVLGWLAALVSVLAMWFPVDLLRELIAVGWAGTGLVSMHYYTSFKALPLYQPPGAAAGNVREVSLITREIADSAKFPGGLDARQRRNMRFTALYTAAVFGLAYYTYVNDMAMLFLTCVGVGLYAGLLLFHEVMCSRSAQVLTISRTGLEHLGQNLPWREIGRAWTGTGRYRRVVIIETPEAPAKRMLQATTWVNRLFAKGNVARGRAGTIAYSVVIDMRFLLGEAAELVQAIEAHRPPGSRWMPAAEVS